MGELGAAVAVRAHCQDGIGLHPILDEAQEGRDGRHQARIDHQRTLVVHGQVHRSGAVGAAPVCQARQVSEGAVGFHAPGVNPVDAGGGHGGGAAQVEADDNRPVRGGHLVGRGQDAFPCGDGADHLLRWLDFLVQVIGPERGLVGGEGGGVGGLSPHVLDRLDPALKARVGGVPSRFVRQATPGGRRVQVDVDPVVVPALNHLPGKGRQASNGQGYEAAVAGRD